MTSVAQQNPNEQSKHVTSGECKHANVLIVDDEATIRHLLSKIIATEYTCITAENAKEARLLLQKHPIKVIVCDHFMPEEDGLTFLTSLRAEQPKLQRILLTGGTNQDILLRAINDGRVFQYLTKPLRPDKLLNVVKEAMREHDGLEEVDVMVDEIISLRAEHRNLPYAYRKLARTITQSLHISGSIFATGFVLMLLLLATATLIAFLIFVMLYFFKSGLGIDLFSESHLTDRLP